MTDTDIDIDIDPEFAAHLRRTLREVAATVDSAADADLGNVVRLVTAPPPTDGGRHRWAWLGAAAITGVAAGAGLMAVAARSPDDAAVPVASTVPVGPVTPSLHVLATRCEEALAGWSMPLPEDWPAQPRPPEIDTATVLLFETEAAAPHQVLVIVDRSTGHTCDVIGNITNPAVTSDGNVFEIKFASPPAPGEVQVVNQWWWNWNDQGVGPGDVFVIGRSGPNVVDVDVEFPDGSVISGEVQHGWFVVEGRVSSDAPMFEERLNWTVASGERNSSRVDLLDAPDEAELCAADASCVSSSLINLRIQAEDLGYAEQAQILADLDVTRDERVAARQRFADCVNASSAGISVTVRVDGGMSFGTAGLESDSDYAEADNVQILCAAAHSDLVDDAWNLLEAQRRVAEG